MSVDRTPINVMNFPDTSVVLTDLDVRLAAVEETAGTIDKIWKFLKVMTPALIMALISGVSHDSILYRLGSALADLSQH